MGEIKETLKPTKAKQCIQQKGLYLKCHDSLQEQKDGLVTVAEGLYYHMLCYCKNIEENSLCNSITKIKNNNNKRNTAKK